MGKLTISMAIFNSYFDITRGYLLQDDDNIMWWTHGFICGPFKGTPSLETMSFAIRFSVFL
jgi:hypothetical protein